MLKKKKVYIHVQAVKVADVFSLVRMCSVCVCSVGERWVAVRADRDPEQPAQMAGSKCSLYVSDL